jgi:hypothetical protein
MAWKNPERSRLRRDLGRHALDQRDVGVGDEEVGLGAGEHDDLHLVILLDGLAEVVEVQHEVAIEQVDRGWSMARKPRRGCGQSGSIRLASA